jgi:hypothetical protein
MDIYIYTYTYSLDNHDNDVYLDHDNHNWRYSFRNILIKNACIDCDVVHSIGDVKKRLYTGIKLSRPY